MNITEVQLLTDNLTQTKHFYQQVIGLELIYADNVLINFKAGNSTLTFHSSYRVDPVYHFAFNIPNNKFDEAMKWAGTRFDLIEITRSGFVAEFTSWNARAFYFYDNNKNIVEMIARFGLDNSSLRPFDGSSIQSISEMGIVVSNPKGYANKLSVDFNLPYFSKQAPKDDFIVLGDDDGLCIIVPENRPWYPTQIRSSPFWSKLSLQQAGKALPVIITT